MDPIITAGTMAALFTDTLMYPIDTIKTRLQYKASAFTLTRIFSGLTPTLLTSAPSAMIFFYTFSHFDSSVWRASFIAEICASTFRIPTDMIKQQLQTFQPITLRNYPQAFVWTMLRDIPFALIQYPLYFTLHDQFQVSACVSGAVSGALAGAITNPLDVIRTNKILKHKPTSLWSGLIPRTTWMCIGGCVFFQTFDIVKGYIQEKQQLNAQNSQRHRQTA